MESTLPTADQQVFELPADLGVAQADDLQKELLKLSQASTDIGIDGGNVEKVHTASLQLLTSLVRDLNKAGHKCHWTQISGVLQQSAGNLGLTEVLNMPTESQNESEIEKESV